MKSVSGTRVDASDTYASVKKVVLSISGHKIQAWEACTFFARLRGLHAIPDLKISDALIIKPCNAIHTFSMKKPIDVVFLDADGMIISCKKVLPLRFSRERLAVCTLEFCAGAINHWHFKPGQIFTREHGAWT